MIERIIIMAEEQLQEFKIVCDRSSHIYRMGEKAKFTISSPEPGMEIQIVFTADGGMELERFTATTPCTVKQGLPFPGFLRCEVSAPGMKTTLAGVGFDPSEIRAALPEPEDFREFWQNALAEQEKIPAQFKCEELPDHGDDGFKILLLECDTVNNAKCYAQLRIPRNGEKMPLMIYYDGAGPSMCQEYFKLHCETTDTWLPAKVAQLAVFAHPYRPPVTRPEHEKIHQEYLDSIGGNYWASGLAEGPKATFFYRSILGAVRMISLVADMPEIDRDRISYLGASQGGGFGFYLAALAPQINAAFCGVPAFCNCGGFLAGQHSTTSQADYFKKHYQVMRYFDPVNFARMIRVPVLASCGFVDTTCQPAGIYAAYNELQGNKMMFHKTLHGHGDAPEEYTPLSWFWTACHMGLCNK